MAKRAAANPEHTVTEHDVCDLAGNKVGLRCRAVTEQFPEREEDDRRCTFIIGHSPATHSWELTDAPPVDLDTLPETDHDR